MWKAPSGVTLGAICTDASNAVTALFCTLYIHHNVNAHSRPLSTLHWNGATLILTWSCGKCGYCCWCCSGVSCPSLLLPELHYALCTTAVSCGLDRNHTYRHYTVSHHNFTIAMRQTAFSYAWNENSITSIFVGWWTSSTGDAKAQTLTNLIAYQCGV